MNRSSARSALALLWPLLLLAALVVLVYRQFVFGNLILGRGDTFLYFYPYWHAAADALRAGRLPLWNPDLFMGAPLLANSQVGFFYPLNWPVWLLLRTPYAVSASIVLHVLIAAGGMYLAARRALGLSRSAALLAGALFALGGYFSAQVEHVNQVQGFAWLPWLLAVTADWQRLPDWRAALRRAAWVALFFALQLLAGHTQTTFITGVALIVWSGVHWLIGIRTPTPAGDDQPAPPLRSLLWLLLALGSGVLLAVLLAAIQLGPTAELTGLSRRSGGLPLAEALSFSLHPLLVPRALLPTYVQTPFSEYVAGLPIAALALAAIGIGQIGRRRALWPPLALLALGLLLAFGEFNPLFKNVIVELPGFSLFRVPARWLVLYAAGMALLAGIGWEALASFATPQRIRAAGAVGLLLVVALIALVPLFARLGQTTIPMPPESPAETPTPMLLRYWGVEALLTALLLLLSGPARPALRWLLWLPLVVSLVFTQRTQLAGALTTPEAYFDVRAAPARMMVATSAARTAGEPTPRFLSISKGYFDPGDMGEIDSIYADQLGDDARYRYLVTTKEREIVAPNLALAYGLSAIDGFDGGLLPLYDYAATVGLMLPPGVETVDGRLREFLTTIPDARWLDLFGVRYLVTDRTGDNWFAYGDDNVFFDLQQRVTLTEGATLNVASLPPFVSSELWIVAEGDAGTVVASGGGVSETVAAEKVTDVVYVARWRAPRTIEQLQLVGATGEWRIAGVSLVDASAGTFRQLVPGDYRLLHAGDVKVYENLDALPRAFVVGDWQAAADIDAAVALMEAAQFDPRRSAVIVGAPPTVAPPTVAPPNAAPPDGAARAATVTVTRYQPERIELSVNTPDGGLLVLTEAYYPGWRATVNGAPVELLKVDGMFRGVLLTAGQATVVFSYRPTVLVAGALVSLTGVLLWGSLLWIGRHRAARPAAPAVIRPRAGGAPTHQSE